MCGRFTLRTNASVWAQQFLPTLDPSEIEQAAAELPRFNIAPTQPVVSVIRPNTAEVGRLERLRWGLVPAWAEDLAMGNRMINARAETIDRKPAFRDAFASQRCLIPADGYFEWMAVADGKQPYLIEQAGATVFAMAGLWERNRRASNAGPILSCTVITTESNSATAEIHDRMPVILHPHDFERWLDPSFRDVAALKELLRPAPDDRLQVTAVSRRVNSPRNDDPACVAPL